MINARKVTLQFTDSTEAEKVQILTSDEITACNTAENPNRIRAAEGELPKKTEEGYLFNVKPASVNVYTFKRK